VSQRDRHVSGEGVDDQPPPGPDPVNLVVVDGAGEIQQAVETSNVSLASRASVSNRLPPGPRLAPTLQAVMRVWLWAQYSDRYHARFGDTFSVRLGRLPQGVVTADRDAIRRLFTGDPLVKRHGNDLLAPVLGEHSVLVLEPAEHLKRRRVLLPPFHGERVQGYGRLMERLVSKQLDELVPGRTTRMQPIAQELTLDVILQAVLGLDDAVTRDRLRRKFDAMVTPLSNLALFIPKLAERSRWNRPGERFWRMKDEIDSLLLGHIAATRADPRIEEREDVLAMMVLARDDDGSGLSDQQLHDELVTLITAGHETTATAISWGLELLTHNPSTMTRAREGDDAYLDALVKEILRIRSPAPIAAGRYLLEPFPIGQWTIPPGVALVVDAYGVHHDPTVYPNPDVFQPERFLGEQPDAYSFLPFGGGAHRCVGATLAMLEMKIFLREILARYELASVSPKEARPVPRAVTLAPRGGARVRVLRERPTANRGARQGAPASTSA
jgi:cytochrome P450